MATYTKLRDGSWGVRLVKGQDRSERREDGNWVEVRRQDGQSRQVRLGRCVWHNETVQLWTISPVAQDAPPRAERTPARVPTATEPVRAVATPPITTPTAPRTANPTIPTPQQPLFDGSECNADDTYMLFYDIPDGADVDMPSMHLRGVAIHFQLSAWVIRGKDIPYRYLNTLVQAGSTVDLLPFDPRASATLIQIAIRGMRREMAAQLRRCEESGIDYARKLDAAPGGKQHEKAQKAYDRAVDQINKRIDSLVDDFGSVAERFGIDPGHLSLSDTRTAARTIRHAMRNRIGAYAQAQQTVAASGTTDGAAMAAAMATNSVPAGIVADYLDDQDHGSGEELREAFADGIYDLPTE